MNSARIVPALLVLALGASGCTTTASRELMLAVQNYDARSREAITAIEAIETKALEQPPVAESQLEQQFVRDMLDTRIKLDGTMLNSAGQPIDPQRLVQGRVHPYDTSVSANPATPALDELRCIHGTFTTAFDDLEQAGFLGKGPVARQGSPILDRLIVQQLLIARLVQGPLRADMRGYKADLIAEIERIRVSTLTDDQKRSQLLSVRTRWLAIEDQENQLTAAAVESLVKAAATGVALRDQMTAYGQWSFSDLVDSANGLTQFIASASGKDMTALNGRIEELRGKIAADPDFQRTVDAALAQVPVPGGALAAAPPVPPAPGGGAATTATPCLAGTLGPAQ